MPIGMLPSLHLPVEDYQVPENAIGQTVSVSYALPMPSNGVVKGLGFPEDTGVLVASLPGSIVLTSQGQTVVIPKNRIWNLKFKTPPSLV
jgi:hypothetical protein